MKKRGSSHLEMILAFSIFLVAVFFLFAYINPFESSKISDVAVISLKDSFLEYVEIEMTTVFVNGTVNERCIPDEARMNFFNGFNSSYQNLTSATYYVVFSDEIQGNLSTCNGDENHGTIRTRKVLSERKIIETRDNYTLNYDWLKQELNVPQAIDFEIEILGTNISMEMASPEELNIVARSYVFPVIDSSGNVSNKEFIFRIW